MGEDKEEKDRLPKNTEVMAGLKLLLGAMNHIEGFWTSLPPADREIFKEFMWEHEKADNMQNCAQTSTSFTEWVGPNLKALAIGRQLEQTQTMKAKGKSSPTKSIEEFK